MRQLFIFIFIYLFFKNIQKLIKENLFIFISDCCISGIEVEYPLEPKKDELYLK
jgi:hypothetical protein